MDILKVQNLAKTYGLRFEYDKNDDSYVLTDINTGETITTYAKVTVSLIKNIAVWREEFSKMTSL